MKLIGLMITRDDGWCLDFTIPAALLWVDELIVMAHCATGSTAAAIMRQANIFGGRIRIVCEYNPLWNEAEYRQKMLGIGRSLGGTHFAIIDGDEAVTANYYDKLYQQAGSLAAGECLRPPWLCLWRDLGQYRSDDSPFGRARVPFVFRDAPHLSHQPKGDYQIHTRIPHGAHPLNVGKREEGGVFHLQHVEWRRLLAKHRLYKIIERLRWHKSPADINSLYDGTVDETGLALTPTPAEWWKGMEYMRSAIQQGQTPWQEQECARLLAARPELADGLELWSTA